MLEKEGMNMYKAVIFDMDGTILNTIEDLNGSLNYALKETGHRHDLQVEDTKICFGSGVKVAITRALCLETGMKEEDLYVIGTSAEVLPASVSNEEINRVQKVVRAYYVNHCKIKTSPYPGILELLRKLRELHIKIAVVSNKQNDAVEKLVKDQFNGYFDFYLGEKSGIKRKPAAIWLKICINSTLLAPNSTKELKSRIYLEKLIFIFQNQDSYSFWMNSNTYPKMGILLITYP